MRKFAAIWFALIAVTLVRAQEPETNLDKLGVYTRIRKATVLVTADLNNISYKTGTGVAIRRFGAFVLIITNAHVVTDDAKKAAPKVTVKAWAREGGKTLPAYVMFQHRADDLYFDAAFLVVNDPTKAIEVAPRGSDPSWEEKTIYACGNPRDEQFLVSSGKVLKGDTIDKTIPWIVTHDALIEHGSSGGGLFNSRGELVGINTWLWQESKGIAMRLDLFDDLFDFQSMTVDASKEDWQPLTAATPKGISSYFAIAIGKWTSDATLGSVNARGWSDGGPKIQDDKNFGSLLMRCGASLVQADRAMFSSAGDYVLYDDATLAQIKGTTDKPEFRINDADLHDNSGSLTVIVAILLPQKDGAFRVCP